MLLQEEIRTPVVDLADEDWTNDGDASGGNLPPEETEGSEPEKEDLDSPTEEDLE